MRERWAVSVLTVVPIPPVLRGCWRGNAGRAGRSAISRVVRRPVVLGVSWAALAATPRLRMLVVLGVGWMGLSGTRRPMECSWCWMWVGSTPAATPRMRTSVVLGLGWSSVGCPAPLVAASTASLAHAPSVAPWARPPNMAFQRSGEIGPILAGRNSNTDRAIQTRWHRRPLNAHPLARRFQPLSRKKFRPRIIISANIIYVEEDTTNLELYM